MFNLATPMPTPRHADAVVMFWIVMERSGQMRARLAARFVAAQCVDMESEMVVHIVNESAMVDILKSTTARI